MADPVLVVGVGGTRRPLSAGSSYRVGRDPHSDIVIDDSRVSWHHAVLRMEHGAWFVQDLGSTNGTFVASRKVDRFEITGDCVLYFGHALDGPAISCSVTRPVSPAPPPQPQAASPPQPQAAPPPQPQAASPPQPQAARSPQPQAARSPQPQAARSPQPQAAPPPQPQAAPPPQPPVDPLRSQSRVDVRPTAVIRAPVKTLRIGRADDNDVVLADLNVSRHHAELRNIGGRYEIVDMGSHNGTFLNGHRITRAPVTERDLVGIGLATFRLVGDELREFIETGDVSLVAHDLTVRADSGQVLIDHVSFPIGERNLVAVIGPSGAGKTTLLRALTGIRPANEGAVLYDNRDLYSHYPELRHRIGLVPQEDVIYPNLTPRRSLGYAAELRFPGDTSPEERLHRVQEVIDELKLMQTSRERPTPPADTQTAALSGGEKKRVSIAMELLTRPSVLFLDEPTSSLDVELKEDVADGMKDLARGGRTVVMVTHDLEYLGKCDRVLVLVPGGKMAFYGPSNDGLRYFGKKRWVEVYRAFRAEPDRDWAGDFRRSSYYAQYVASGLNGQAPQAARAAAEPPVMPRSRSAQLSILCRRYTALIAADRGFLISLAALPIVFGAIVRVLAGSKGLTAINTETETALLFLAIIASLTGAASSIREILKERPIYLRERTAGLSAGAYLLSKFVVLGFISFLQAALLVVIGLAGEPGPNRGVLLPSVLLEILLAVALLTIASMALGLLVSAIITSSEKTMQALVLISIAQVVLTGALLMPLPIGLSQISYVAPARWGFGATASTVNLNAILSQSPHPQFDLLWGHDSSHWLTSMVMMAVLIVVYLLIAWWWLIRISPGRSRR